MPTGKTFPRKGYNNCGCYQIIHAWGSVVGRGKGVGGYLDRVLTAIYGRAVPQLGNAEDGLGNGFTDPFLVYR